MRVGAEREGLQKPPVLSPDLWAAAAAARACSGPPPQPPSPPSTLACPRAAPWRSWPWPPSAPCAWTLPAWRAAPRCASPPAAPSSVCRCAGAPPGLTSTSWRRAGRRWGRSHRRLAGCCAVRSPLTPLPCLLPGWAVRVSGRCLTRLTRSWPPLRSPPSPAVHAGLPPAHSGGHRHPLLRLPARER